jgi:Asp-tRNA(Asn)/Glu-tRNA(Gln) amidotransferase B subunit
MRRSQSVSGFNNHRSLSTLRQKSPAASEVFRHIELLTCGKEVKQETRGFNEEKAETYLLRSKEDAPDYRYMPDPNIPPLLLTEVTVTPHPELSHHTEIDAGVYREDSFFYAGAA